MTSLKITLLTVGVLEIADDVNEEEALEDVEFFCEPGEDAIIDYDPNSLIASWRMTNDFWHLVPDLERECDADEERIWQQIIWQLEGDFVIPQDQNSLSDYLQASMGCNLWIETQYEVNLVEYHFKIISVSELLASAQTKCFRCYIELSAENEKAWLKNDGLCPNCATPLSVEDEACYSCNKPAVQEDEILFCISCFELVSEELDDA